MPLNGYVRRAWAEKKRLKMQHQINAVVINEVSFVLKWNNICKCKQDKNWYIYSCWYLFELFWILLIFLRYLCDFYIFLKCWKTEKNSRKRIKREKNKNAKKRAYAAERYRHFSPEQQATLINKERDCETSYMQLCTSRCGRRHALFITCSIPCIH